MDTWTPVWSGRVSNEGSSLVVALQVPGSGLLKIDEHNSYETGSVILTSAEIEELFGSVLR